MPFIRRLLPTLRSDIADDIERHSPGLDAHQRGSFENASALAQAGAMHLLYGALDYHVKQLFDSTAEDEFIERRAAPFGITRIAAQPATGNINITGNDGGTVAAGDRLTVGNAIYVADATVVIAGGVGVVPVTAVLQPKENSSELDGAGTNQNAGTQLTFINPPSNVSANATVASGGLTGGSDIESVERFKARFAERKKTPPRGGAKSDYIAWCKQASVDVTRAFVYGHLNDSLATEYGSVLIYPVTDDLASPIPGGTLLTTISDYIDLPAIRPVGAKNVYVEALTPVNLNLVFSALSPNTTEVRAAIEAEVRDMLSRDAIPGTTVYLSHIREAISLAVGETDFTLSSPSANITLAANELLVWGTPTWP